jgi:hypothetical protein
MTQTKVIETRYYGPTDYRGARIAAFDAYADRPNKIIIGFPHELSGAECHAKAAQALCDKMGWKGELTGGWTKGGCAFALIA